MVGLLDQRQRQFLCFQVHREARARLFGVIGESFAIPIQFFLVSRTHIAEPFPIWHDAPLCRVSWSLLHFFQVWLGFVHIQSVDRGSRPKLRPRFAARRVRSIGIRTGFTFVESRPAILFLAHLLFLVQHPCLLLEGRLGLLVSRRVSFRHICQSNLFDRVY